jgi:hypothetical protein
MNGPLTYCEQRPKGFDPVNDPADLILDALGYFLREVSFEVLIELLFYLLELF